MRLASYRYLEKMGLLDEQTVKESLMDISPNIRKEAIVSYITME